MAVSHASGVEQTMLMTSRRTANTLASLDGTNEISGKLLQCLANEGQGLRVALRDQQRCNKRYSHGQSDAQYYFQNIQHAAISIYLSGIFDYHEENWTQYCIPVPKLQPTEIEDHVATILDQVERAFGISEPNSISYVFALRVAGARSWSMSRQEKVRALLKRIERCYAGANALSVDLLRLWTSRSSLQVV
jgi:hypothetical protein